MIRRVQIGNERNPLALYINIFLAPFDSRFDYALTPRALTSSHQGASGFTQTGLALGPFGDERRLVRLLEIIQRVPRKTYL